MPVIDHKDMRKQSLLDAPLRVAAIEPSGRLYGSEYCLLDIMAGLPREQFDWHVFLPPGKGFDELLQQIDIDCEFLVPADLGDFSALRKSIVYGRILKRLWQLKPQLLYVNQTGSLRSAAMYARWLRLPVVCQVQTLEDARWLSCRPELHSCVQAFICNSQFIGAASEVDAEKKCILYQGIAAERVENAQKNAERRRQRAVCESSAVLTIGILGRIAVSKGHYVLVEAAKKLQAIRPTCRFVVIGEGLTPSDTKHYQDAVEAAGLSEMFEFRGYRTDIGAELAGIDILAIPSIAEPLGRVLFDAAEYGVPVVVSDAGGLGELAHEFQIGSTFPSQNAEALAYAIDDLANHYQRGQAAFHKAAIAMLTRLSMGAYLDKVQQILVSATSRQTSHTVWLGEPPSVA